MNQDSETCVHNICKYQLFQLKTSIDLLIEILPYDRHASLAFSHRFNSHLFCKLSSLVDLPSVLFFVSWTFEFEPSLCLFKFYKKTNIASQSNIIKKNIVYWITWGRGTGGKPTGGFIISNNNRCYCVLQYFWFIRVSSFISVCGCLCRRQLYQRWCLISITNDTRKLRYIKEAKK